MSEQTASGQVAETTVAAGTQTPPPAPPPQGEGGQTGSGTPPGPIPYERFAEVNTQLTELKKWRAEQEKTATAARKAAEDAEAKRLAENNEFKTLAEQRAAKLAELEPLGERVKGLEAVIQGVYEARLKELPEAARKAVDALPGLSVEQKLAWLNENGALFAKASPPNINAGAQSASGPQLDEARAAEIAAIYGVNAKYIRG